MNSQFKKYFFSLSFSLCKGELSGSDQDSQDDSNGILVKFTSVYNMFMSVLKKIILADEEYRYSEAQQSDHSDHQIYWDHIEKTIFDFKDNEHFVILSICTCNKHAGLFYKYIAYVQYESYKEENDDSICEYSPCEELLDSKSYKFVDPVV